MTIAVLKSVDTTVTLTLTARQLVHHPDLPSVSAATLVVHYVGSRAAQLVFVGYRVSGKGQRAAKLTFRLDDEAEDAPRGPKWAQSLAEQYAPAEMPTGGWGAGGVARS